MRLASARRIRRRSPRPLAWLGILACLVPATARADAPAPFVASTRASDPPAGAGIAFGAALSDDADVVLFPKALRPAPRPEVIVVTRVHAPPDAIGAVLLEPARYHRALPALLRADVVEQRPGLAPFGPDRLLEWELQFPFFNLHGRAWLSRQADAIELALCEGAFAPGRLRVQLAPTSDGRGTVMTSTTQIEPRSANWIIRRIVKHDAWAEAAMTAAAAWVLTRAVALLAEAGAAERPARPTGPTTPPGAAALDGAPLAGAAGTLGLTEGLVATVRRNRTGRLAWVSAAVAVRGEPGAVGARLAQPEAWRVFPGWKSVKRLPVPPGSLPAGAPAPPVDFEVMDDVAFVDLDAIWRLSPALPGRARVVEGSVAGAVLAWQSFPGPTAATTTAVLSQHPRLDLAGFIEKKMVAAEPLLEHAFALALTYADAVAVAASLQ